MNAVRLVVLCLISTSLWAQEPAAPEKNNGGSPAVEALKAWASTPVRALRGNIKEIEAAGSPQGMRVMVGGGGESRPFTGEVEFLQTEANENLVVSRTTLPGMVYFRSAEREIKQITVEKKPVGVGTIPQDLDILFEVHRLITALQDTKWDVRADNQTGSTTFSSELPVRLIRAEAAEGPVPFSAKVMRFALILIVDADGKLDRLTFSVTRSNPLAGMQRRAMSSGGRIQMTTADDDDDELEEGKTTEYIFKALAITPSERTKSTLAAMRELIGAEGR